MKLSTTKLVAASVRAECARQRVSQRDVARALELSHTSVHRRIRGDVPFDVDELAKIAELLGLSIHDLLPDDSKASV